VDTVLPEIYNFSCLRNGPTAYLVTAKDVDFSYPASVGATWQCLRFLVVVIVMYTAQC